MFCSFITGRLGAHTVAWGGPSTSGREEGEAGSGNSGASGSIFYTGAEADRRSRSRPDTPKPKRKTKTSSPLEVLASKYKDDVFSDAEEVATEEEEGYGHDEATSSHYFIAPEPSRCVSPGTRDDVSDSDSNTIVSGLSGSRSRTPPSPARESADSTSREQHAADAFLAAEAAEEVDANIRHSPSMSQVLPLTQGGNRRPKLYEGLTPIEEEAKRQSLQAKFHITTDEDEDDEEDDAEDGPTGEDGEDGRQDDPEGEPPGGDHNDDTPEGEDDPQDEPPPQDEAPPDGTPPLPATPPLQAETDSDDSSLGTAPERDEDFHQSFPLRRRRIHGRHRKRKRRGQHADSPDSVSIQVLCLSTQ